MKLNIFAAAGPVVDDVSLLVAPNDGCGGIAPKFIVGMPTAVLLLKLNIVDGVVVAVIAVIAAAGAPLENENGVAGAGDGLAPPNIPIDPPFGRPD